MKDNLIIDKEILKYDSSHIHPEKEYDVSLSIMKHKIKDGIEKSSIPLGIKIKPLNNIISKEMGLISEIPSESEYYKTKRAKLFREYNDDIFVDIKNDNNIFIYYEAISNLQFINPEYIFDIYDKTYLIDYDMKFWNYYNNMEAINKANKISVLIERYKNIEAKLIDAKSIIEGGTG
ncbi:hypothetical protein H8356DRAFT_1333985 [Neocallimastix lanati (nom. inval.)]|nr:hypothetical protein H8356DRAFT_1333985 [Neocallimastix sp. JGI-2020a]